MPKCSREETKKKREEIVDACSKLYETMAYKDITIKDAIIIGVFQVLAAVFPGVSRFALKSLKSNLNGGFDTI